MSGKLWDEDREREYDGKTKMRKKRKTVNRLFQVLTTEFMSLSKRINKGIGTQTSRQEDNFFYSLTNFAFLSLIINSYIYFKMLYKKYLHGVEREYGWCLIRSFSDPHDEPPTPM